MKKKQILAAACLAAIVSVSFYTPSHALGKVCSVDPVWGVAEGSHRKKTLRKAKQVWSDVVRNKYGRTMGLARAIKSTKNKTCEVLDTGYRCYIVARPCRRPEKNYLTVNNKCLPEPDYRTAAGHGCKWFKK